MAGLTGVLALLLTPFTPLRLLCGLPLLALLGSGLRPWRGWGLTTALLMLPYCSAGIAEFIANPEERPRSLLFALLTAGTFLAGLDFQRRRRSSRGPARARV
jgi:hypothetical protein